MRILVISDTHGAIRHAFAAYSLVEPVDMVIHLGDGNADALQLRSALDIPVLSVPGNCDTDSYESRELLWECEGKQIFMTHGDEYHVKSGVERLRQRAVELKADVVLFGHTHQKVVVRRAGMLMINPGSLANYSPIRSFALLSVDGDTISVSHGTLD